MRRAPARPVPVTPGGTVLKDVVLFVVKVVLYLAVLIADFAGDGATAVFG